MEAFGDEVLQELLFAFPVVQAADLNARLRVASITYRWSSPGKRLFYRQPRGNFFAGLRVIAAGGRFKIIRVFFPDPGPEHAKDRMPVHRGQGSFSGTTLLRGRASAPAAAAAVRPAGIFHPGAAPAVMLNNCSCSSTCALLFSMNCSTAGGIYIMFHPVPIKDTRHSWLFQPGHGFCSWRCKRVARLKNFPSRECFNIKNEQISIQRLLSPAAASASASARPSMASASVKSP